MVVVALRAEEVRHRARCAGVLDYDSSQGGRACGRTILTGSENTRWNRDSKGGVCRSERDERHASPVISAKSCMNDGRFQRLNLLGTRQSLYEQLIGSLAIVIILRKGERKGDRDKRRECVSRCDERR